MTKAKPELTERFVDALGLAVKLHAGGVRKGTSVPYVAHPLAVCALVLVAGGDEDEAIAALLHDVLEDAGDKVIREDLAARFGGRVRDLVAAVTETPPGYHGGPKAPWPERKEAYVEHVRRASEAENRIALADKVDNARAIVADYRTLGDGLWERFHAGREQQLWYYRALVDAFRAAGAHGYLFDELVGEVTELESLAARA
jgi:GTP pyrophosphokinase